MKRKAQEHPYMSSAARRQEQPANTKIKPEAGRVNDPRHRVVKHFQVGAVCTIGHHNNPSCPHVVRARHHPAPQIYYGHEHVREHESLKNGF